MTYIPVFQEWPHISRLDRPIVVTEKLDGTNGAICIVHLGPLSKDHDYLNDLFTVVLKGFDPEKPDEPFNGEDYLVYAQSRTKIITRGKSTDNHGFAAWVADNASTLVDDLGPGTHFGEWWGSGIQRGYGMNAKNFSLFNTKRWSGVDFTTPALSCVPVLGTFEYFDRQGIWDCLTDLENNGSRAAPGFMDPEGVVVFHTQGNMMFKKTIKNDDRGKTYGH